MVHGTCSKVHRSVEHVSCSMQMVQWTSKVHDTCFMIRWTSSLVRGICSMGLGLDLLQGPWGLFCGSWNLFYDPWNLFNGAHNMFMVHRTCSMGHGAIESVRWSMEWNLFHGPCSMVREDALQSIRHLIWSILVLRIMEPVLWFVRIVLASMESAPWSRERVLLYGPWKMFHGPWNLLHGPWNWF